MQSKHKYKHTETAVQRETLGKNVTLLYNEENLDNIPRT